MKKKYLLFILALLYVPIALSQTDKALLLGKWVNFHNPDNYFIFDTDSLKFGLSNSFEFSQTWQLQKPGMVVAEFNPYYYFLSDSFMVILTMKDQLDQVDEIALYSKNKGRNLPYCKNPKVRITVSNYKPGLYMVLLPNFQRFASDITIKASREITFSQNFVESSIFMTPIDFAWKNFDVYLDGRKLPIYFSSELHGDKDRSRSNQNEDSIVCIYGFNQIGRQTINYELKRQIDGDILMFYIGPYKDFNSKPTSFYF